MKVWVFRLPKITNGDLTAPKLFDMKKELYDYLTSLPKDKNGYIKDQEVKKVGIAIVVPFQTEPKELKRAFGKRKDLMKIWFPSSVEVLDKKLRPKNKK